MKNFSLSQFSLNNKAAVITGGASGLGRYYSLALCAAPARVLVISRSTNGWEGLKKEIEGSGGTIAFFQQDLTKPHAA